VANSEKEKASRRSKKISIPKEQIQRYLGFFYVPLSSKQLKSFQKKVSFASAYVCGDMRFIRKFGCAFLLAWGNLSYELKDAFFIVEDYFKRTKNKEFDDTLWFDSPYDVLIIRYLTKTLDNRLLEDMLNYILVTRHLDGKVTLILAESELKDVHRTAKKYMIDVFVQKTHVSAEHKDALVDDIKNGGIPAEKSIPDKKKSKNPKKKRSRKKSPKATAEQKDPAF